MENRQKEAEILLEMAMKQPGVAEISRLIDSQESAITHYQQAQHNLFRSHWIITVSTSSSPRLG